MEFLVSALKSNRKAVYADLKAKAEEKKLKVFPIMFGRAQALLGIVESAKRGQGKAAKAKAASTGGKRGRQPDASSKSGKIRELLKTGMSAVDIAKKVGCTPALVYNVKARAGGSSKAARRPGRPARATAGLNGLSSILDTVRNAERERVRLRAAMEKLQTVIAVALS